MDDVIGMGNDLSNTDGPGWGEHGHRLERDETDGVAVVQGGSNGGRGGDGEAAPPNGSDVQHGSEHERTALNLLYSEYQRVSDYFSRQFEYVLRVAGIGFSASAALLFLIANDNDKLPRLKGEWTFWAAPLALALLYGILIDLFYQMVFAGYYVRKLEDDIARRTGIGYFHYHNAGIRGVMSFRGGHPPRLANYVLLLLFGVSIYIAVVAVSFEGLRTGGHVPAWRQAAYLALQGALGGILAWSAVGLTLGLRDKFDKWIYLSDEGYRQQLARGPLSSLSWNLVSYAILPRRLDFVVKMPITVGAGLMTAWFLRQPLTWHLVLVLLEVVICVEFLAKQATYIWNEILDLPADRSHAYKKDRRILARAGEAGATLGKFLFLTRGFAALAMAAALSHEHGLVWLPWLVVFIFGMQFFYDRWAKRGPVRRLCVASIGYAERALAGILVVMTVADHYDPVLILLLGGWVVVFQFSTLAHLWWAETWYLWLNIRERFRQPAGATHPRINAGPRPIWFLLYGTKSEWLANMVLFFVGSMLAFMYGAGAASTTDGLAHGRLVTAATPPASQPVALRNDLDAALHKVPHAIARAVSWIGNRIGDVRSWAHPAAEQLPFSTSIWAAIGLAAVAMAAMVLIRWTLRRKAGASEVLARAIVQGSAVAPPRPEERMVPARWRWRLNVALLVVAAVGFLVLPAELWLFVVALGLPLLLAVNFEWMTYVELNALDILLNEKLNRAIPWIGAALFSPWAARISIAPVGEGATGEATRWADGLREVYKQWAHTRGLSVEEVGDDGGYRKDVIVRGHQFRWHPLLKESGFHERRIVVPGRAVESAPETVVAWVNVTPISVPTQETLGAGLQYPDAPPVSRAASVPATNDLGPAGPSGTNGHRAASQRDGTRNREERADPPAVREFPPPSPADNGHAGSVLTQFVFEKTADEDYFRRAQCGKPERPMRKREYHFEEDPEPEHYVLKAVIVTDPDAKETEEYRRHVIDEDLRKIFWDIDWYKKSNLSIGFCA